MSNPGPQTHLQGTMVTNGDPSEHDQKIDANF
jgi:hypothetical protein